MKNIFDTLKQNLGNALVREISPARLHVLIPKDDVKKIPEAAKTLSLRLVFLFASDERKEKNAFAVYYVLASENENKFVIFETNTGEKSPYFPSLTPFLPQANWHEREIRDLFGLIPEGHPDPRPLILHEDWPKDFFPLRKDFKGGEIPRL